MKDFKIEEAYLEDYGVKVKPYLSYAQIQTIVNGLKNNNEWDTRNTDIDMLLLYFCTDIEKGELEKVGHEKLLTSGLIDEVKKNVRNLSQVYEAIDYTESAPRALIQIAEKLPEYFKPLEKVVNKHARKSSKK